MTQGGPAARMNGRVKHWCASFRFGHELCWALVPAFGDICAGCRVDLSCYFCQRAVSHVHIARPAAKAAA